MGGKALKEAFTRRQEKDEYFELWKTLKSLFEKSFPDVRIALVEAYENKESFGDMDVLIEGEKMPDNWHDNIVEIYQVTETAFITNKESMKNVNGIGFTTEMLMNRPLSFDFMECQIDMVPMPTASMDFALKYLGFNDLGNIMGKVYRRLGAKMSMHGLQVIPLDAKGGRMPNYPVTLTTDWDDALTFAGYDPERFKRGFQSIADIYEYAASSTYFNPMMFLEGNTVNNTERVRIRNRTNYREFINWCENNRSELNQAIVMEPAAARARVFDLFPNAQHGCEVQVAAVELERKQNKRMSGNLVKEITGVKGKSLGMMIEFMKSEFEGNQDFLKWQNEQSDQQLKDWIITRHQDWLTV